MFMKCENFSNFLINAEIVFQEQFVQLNKHSEYNYQRNGM